MYRHVEVAQDVVGVALGSVVFEGVANAHGVLLAGPYRALLGQEGGRLEGRVDDSVLRVVHSDDIGGGRIRHWCAVPG